MASLKIDHYKKVVDVLVCGADEKIIRLFEAPAIFVNYLRKRGSECHLYFESEEQEREYLSEGGEYRTTTEGGA